MPTLHAKLDIISFHEIKGSKKGAPQSALPSKSGRWVVECTHRVVFSNRSMARANSEKTAGVKWPSGTKL